MIDPKPVTGYLRLAPRWIASMGCFLVFGAGGLLFGLVVVPLVVATSPSAEVRVRRLRHIAGLGFRTFMWLTATVRGISYEVAGLPAPTEPCLIIANHPTLIDAVVLLALFPQADCIVKHGLLRNPFTRFALLGLDHISNADTPTMLATATERLRAGRSLLIFPEGTRSQPGTPVQFHLAAAALAIRSGRPCLPVVLYCDPPTTSKAEPWYRIAPQRPRYRVDIRTPLAVGDFVRNHPDRHAKRVLNAFLESYYNRALETASDTRASLLPTEPDQHPSLTSTS